MIYPLCKGANEDLVHFILCCPAFHDLRQLIVLKYSRQQNLIFISILWCCLFLCLLACCRTVGCSLVSVDIQVYPETVAVSRGISQVTTKQRCNHFGGY